MLEFDSSTVYGGAWKLSAGHALEWGTPHVLSIIDRHFDEIIQKRVEYFLKVISRTEKAIFNKPKNTWRVY